MNIPSNKNVLALVISATLGLASTEALATQNWSYTYNTNGQVLTADGPRTDVSDVTTYTYDATGNLATITNTLGHVTQLQDYNGRGHPGKMIDPNGVETLLTYHVRGWLLTSTVKDPSGNSANDATTTYGYDNVGQVTSITLPDSTVLNYEYDAAHRLTAVSNSLSERIEYTLDLQGNRTKEDIKSDTGVITKTLTRTYDELSRLLQLIGAGGQTTTYSYDTNGNVIAITDGNTNQTDQGYDALNRLVTEDAPLNSASDYFYDERDNLTEVIDPKGLSTHYSYDGFDNLTQLDSPDTGISNYTYDEANNRLTQTDANGVVTTYSYDALNRLTSISYPNTALNITYGYDAGSYGKGRLTSITDASGNTVLDYDHRGNLTGQASDIGTSTYNLGYGYDHANQLVQVVYPNGRTLDYVRDVTGLVIEATTSYDGNTQILASNVDYKPFGPMTQLDYGNSIQQTASYDLDYRLTDLVHGAVRDTQYSYDNNSNITGIADNLNTPADQSFTYDALNRLTNAAGIYGTLSYTYDENGNRLTYTDSSGVDNYTYDANSHRLLSTNDWTYQYDNNGNQISKLDTGGSGLLYTYDDHNRLTEVKDALTSSTLATYTYNAYGQRVIKTTPAKTTHYLYSLSGQLLNELDDNGDSREYLYLNGEPLAVVENIWTQNPPIPGSEFIYDNDSAQTSSTGNWQSKNSSNAYGGTYRLSSKMNRTYAWTIPVMDPNCCEAYARWPGVAQHNKNATYTLSDGTTTQQVTVDQSTNGNQWVLLGNAFFVNGGTIELSDAGGKTAADAIKIVEGDTPQLPTFTSNLYYIHNDHLGTPQVITDSAQNIVWGADYEPYGEVSVHANSIANNLRFPGQYFDEETNLHYNYFRDYDPSIGRYVQSDPIGLRGGINTYLYAKANPIIFTDPNGLREVYGLGGGPYSQVNAVRNSTIPSGAPNQSIGEALSDDCLKICQIDVLVEGVIVDIGIGAIPQFKAAQVIGKAALGTASVASTSLSLANCVKQCEEDEKCENN